MEPKEKKRRQVSFNIDDNLYTEFKKLMLEDRTTPTAYITRSIMERVQRGSANKQEEN
jgi:hypothetical protein